jgi:ubiquinone/menaquinone biosynthesis C-methylase UbiE
MNCGMHSSPDWGDGAYEQVAPALEAPAEHLIQVADPQIGERAVDLGCGSGNATLPLAAAGTQVTAIDPSPRLLDIAAQRARTAGHRITQAVARAEALPLPDGEVDLVVSNFGIIFATDPAAAFAEILRVLAPDGRLVYTAWQPRGAIDELRILIRRARAEVTPPRDGREETSAAFAWHAPSTFAHLIPGAMDGVTVHDAEAHFVAESAEAWMREQESLHPVWLAAREHIADDVVWRRLVSESIELLAARSTADDRLDIASPYSVVEIHPRR